jgi:hypothetical protein
MSRDQELSVVIALGAMSAGAPASAQQALMSLALAGLQAQLTGPGVTPIEAVEEEEGHLQA